MNSFVLISEKKCVFTPCVRGKTWLETILGRVRVTSISERQLKG